MLLLLLSFLMLLLPCPSLRYRDGALAKQLIRIDALGGKQVKP